MGDRRGAFRRNPGLECPNTSYQRFGHDHGGRDDERLPRDSRPCCCSSIPNRAPDASALSVGRRESLGVYSKPLALLRRACNDPGVAIAVGGPDMALPARLERHATVASSLAALRDGELAALMDAAPALGAGIGGTRSLLHVGGVPVFVKRVPLTDLERRNGHVRSTVNLFELPTFCQYGVASPATGAWRELAASEMATSWVLAGRAKCFPLLHHWRVLDRPAWLQPLPDELADIERVVAFWHGSPAVRSRIEAIAGATTSLTLFFEWVPEPLPAWLARQVIASDAAAERAITMVERRLLVDVDQMNAAGLHHFDAHLDNILTDGERLYFTDLALAMSPQFELSTSEARFLDANLTHDRCYAITRLVNWLVTTFTRASHWQARNEIIGRVAAGEALAGVASVAAAVIVRHAPVAAVINDFYRQLHLVDRRTPYPAAAARAAWTGIG
jgi:hypothetical protein